MLCKRNFIVQTKFGKFGKIIYNKIIVSNRKPKLTFYERYVKRCLDVVFAICLLIVLSPLFLILILLSKIFIHGHVFFQQVRPGQGGQVFKIYKFRTMTEKTDAQGNLLPDAVRITIFGKFLRRFCLDELPQLVNILRGEMSFVGPRPRAVKDAVFYTAEQLQVYRIRPGLTGLAQVSGGRSRVSWNQIFAKDLAYQQKITFWGDILIVIKTVFVLLFYSDGAVSGSAQSQREYYYADYLMKHNYITKEQYQQGLATAKSIIATNGIVTNYVILNPSIKGDQDMESELKKLPQHIGFIIDGNGRWAKERGLPRTKGHEQGIKSLDTVIKTCFYQYGIPIVSIYAFSTENWNRPKTELDCLFKYFTKYLKTNDFVKKYPHVRLNIMGDYTKFPADLVKNAEQVLEATKNETQFILNLGINYSGQDELVRAVNLMLADGLTPTVTRETIQKYLYTAEQPLLDFVVRTSGEQRLSNFMLWQVSYAELYFPKTYWPAFGKEDLHTALLEYQRRDRRFGSIKEKDA